MFDKHRLTSLMHTLTEETVLGDLLAPLQRALSRVRPATAPGRVLSSEAFISLGVRHHLQSTSVLREQIQQLLHLMGARGLPGEVLEDEKASREQDRRQAALADQAVGTERPPWSASLYRYTSSKLSRQVLRSCKSAFLKTASPQLYERQLRPLLMTYL